MSIAMPAPDNATLAKRDRIIAAMRAIVPGEGVIDDPDSLRPWESDGLRIRQSADPTHLQLAPAE